ncbi:hypothetical protein E5K91_03185 [Helicobacter pylori]|nr:hypothetical protein [Helicobacter pylori]EQL63700.1 hypothetical protein N406_04930 [Helicobacter pylori FD577]WQY18897.1 hypothetical protein KVM09_03510 [Helicobacter pylori]WQY21750.1 hypothetical protein KVM92_03525 [Helicobacter pylori]WQY40183.1 hypothetical protein KVK25_03405 [Helicobacter pylori]WQZ36487.1 hypothetical protein E5P93_03170 [Helicobacter pylori]
MHQNNKTFLPTPSAHLSKIILFLNAGFLAYVYNSNQYYDMLLVNH